MALKGRLSGVSILVFFVISAGLWTLGIAAEEQQSDPGIVICGKMTMTLNHKWSYLIPYIGPTECQPVLNASVDVFDDPDTAYTDWTGGVKFRFVIDIDDNTDLYYAVITAGATLEEKVSDYPPVYHKIDHRTTAHITPAGTEDTSIILEFATDTVSATDVTKNYRVTAGGRIQVSGYVFTYPSWNDSDTESDIIVANRSHSQWQQVVELLMVLPGPPYYIGDNLRLLGGVSTESGEGDPVSETEVCIVLATQRGFGSQTIYTETPPAGGGINEVFSIDNPMGAGILTISAYDKAKSEEYVFDEDGEEIKINLEVPEDWSTFGMYSIPCSEAQIPGLAAAYSVNLVSFNDFSGMVDLAVSGLPDATTAAFDIDPGKIGSSINKTPVYDLKELMGRIPELGATVAIITVPSRCAQEVAELVIDAGIYAIWNFTNVKLKVPSGVLVQKEDLSSGYAVLSVKIRTVYGDKGSDNS